MTRTDSQDLSRAPFPCVEETVRGWCLRELAPWIAERPEPSDLRARLDRLNATTISVFLLRIQGDTVTVLDKPNFYRRAEIDDPERLSDERRRFHGMRAAMYREFLETAARAAGGAFDMVVALATDDGTSISDVPILTFQRREGERSILIPDIDFIGRNFYRDASYEDEAAFLDKSDKAIFIGSTTGALNTINSVTHAPSPRIEAAVRFRDSRRVEFRLPSVVQCESPEVEALIHGMGVTGPRMTWPEQMRHKFLISMDGNGATCSRVALALKSNSVLLKYKSQSLLYYFDTMSPWTHYIPIDQHDTVEQIVAIEQDRPGSFEMIAKAGSTFYQTFLTEEMVVRYTSILLRTYQERVAGGGRPRPLPVKCLLHLRDHGDVRSEGIGWHGAADGAAWIEGLALEIDDPYLQQFLEYQAINARGETTSWCRAGGFCGERGRNTALTGLRLRIGGPGAAAYRCDVSVVGVDGRRAPPAPVSEWRRTDPPSPIAAFRVEITRR